MATTERGVFLHWKKVEPLSKTKKQLSNRGGCEGVRTTQSTDRKGGVTDKKQDSEVLVGVAKTDTGVVTLRDLCPQDKAKVRGLVEQLASVGQEKEELETAIEEDRRQFTLLLDRLKIEHKKVLSEKRRVVEELHSSQLQLHQLHTYPSLPHTTPRASSLHESRTSPGNNHMKSTSNQMTPLSDNLTSKSPPMTAPTCTQTITPTETFHSFPPKLDPTNEGGYNNSANDRGCRDFTPHSDDWHTLPPSSPQPCTVPLIPHHMTSRTDHMTATTMKASPTHRDKLHVPTPTPVIHVTGTPSRDIATQTIQSTATQTQHSPDPLTISDLVTMETTPPVQSHSEKVKDETTPTLPINPICITPTRKKKSSGNAASTSPSQNGSQTNTRSLLNRSPRKNATCMYSSYVGTSTINVVPSIASSSVGNDTLSSEQLESLLASALLNAQQTLNSIQTLSHSVEQEGTILVNSSTCGLSRTNTRDDVSAPVDKTLLSGSSSRDRSSAIHNNNGGDVLGQSMCSDGIVATDKRGGSNKMATPSSRKQFELDYELSALDTELAATLNPREIAEHSTLNTREIAEHSTLNTREIEHAQNQRARQVSTAEALCSNTDFEITGLGNLWNVRKNNFSIARNCPKKKSSTKHTQERDVGSVLKHSRSDLRSGRLKTSTGGGAGGGAVTSTPSYVECGGNGMISHRLESLLGSSIEDSDDSCFSEVLDHAHSLSRRLHIDSYSELDQSSNHDDSSDRSDTVSDDDIIDELFFI